MKFIVDCMLGKLAKWLRVLGFDTLYFSRIKDEELIRLAEESQRILLTRDTKLLDKNRKPFSLLIVSEKWWEQLRQVLKEFSLKDKIKPYSRCLECNTPLKDLNREDARNLVSPFIYQNSEAFSVCPTCQKVYWRGTHINDMEEKLAGIFEEKKENKTG